MKFFFNKTRHKKPAVTLTSIEDTLLQQLQFSPEPGIAIKGRTNNPIEGLYELQWFEDYEHEPKLRGIKSILDKKVSIPSMLAIVKQLQTDGNCV